MMRGLVGGALVVLATVSAAVAQDACLSGASELGDERALVALGEAIQQQCPCNETKRPRRNERVLYQNCSRNVVKQTVLAGELRRECLSTGYERAFRATCATNKKTCGHYDPTRPDPVRCRIASPAQCEDGGTAIETVCTGQTNCSDVIDWTAGTCVDPRQRGPFEAGARLLTVTKKSQVNRDQDRVLELVIWYPAVPGAAPIDASFDAVPDAPLARDGAPYPILMFSHGSCGYPRQSLFLTALLATYGFVVVAPPHPGNTITDFPNCGTPAAQIASAAERTPDIVFSLDTMLAENQDPQSFFFGSIDPERIGMSGHSFGGLTTYLVAGFDSRFRVAVPMAPAILANQRPLRVPSLTMIGKIDATVNNTATRGAFDVASAPKMLVEIGDTGHYAFADGCFTSPDCNPPVTRTQDEAHALVLRWVLPFLKVYLEGDPSYEPFLSAPPPPGITDVQSVRETTSVRRQKIR